MILSLHLLTGAAIVSKTHYLPLALPLAFLSHYLLDVLPHTKEYSVERIRAKDWKSSFPDFLKIGLDLALGLFLIFLISKNQSPAVYAGALLASLPDGFTFLGILFSNRFLKENDDLNKKIHFLKRRKVHFFWKVFCQIAVLFLAIFFLL